MLTRNEEVGGGLPIGRLVAHVDEVLTGLVRRAKVDLLALIDEADFVEVLVQLLASLVYSKDSRLPCNVGGDTERLNELEGGGRAAME